LKISHATASKKVQNFNAVVCDIFITFQSFSEMKIETRKSCKMTQDPVVNKLPKKGHNLSQFF
jgi:hypothetical protein